MKTIYQAGRVSIIRMEEDYGPDFYVYEGERLVRVCPSEGMAFEVAAGCN